MNNTGKEPNVALLLTILLNWYLNVSVHIWWQFNMFILEAAVK